MSESAHYADLLQQRESDIKGHRQLAALDEIEANFENMRTAWNWAVQQKNYDLINRALESLDLFCSMRGRYREAEALFQLARERFAPRPGGAPHPVWGRIVARYPDPEEERKAQIERSLAIAQKCNDQREIAYCLQALGHVTAWGERDFAGGLAFFEQSLVHYRDSDKFYIAGVLRSIGGCYQFMGRLEEAIKFTQQGLDLRREIGDRIGASSCLLSIGISTFMVGNYAQAENYLREAHEIGRELGSPSVVTTTNGFLSLLAFLNGKFAKAVAQAEETLAAATDLGDPEGRQIPLITLGMVANAEEDYEKAEQILKGTQFLPQAQVFADWGLSVAACGLKDHQMARQHNQVGRKRALALHSPAWTALYLPVTALILAHEAEKERAVELLALAFTHPASATGWMEKWPLLTRVRADLEAELSPEVYVAAWERGKTLELETVAKQILAEASA